MRLLIALLLLPVPAQAWEAITDGPICILRHETDAHSTQVTHDPRRALPYEIDIKLNQAEWNPADIFAIRFEGAGRLTISTDQHSYSDDQTTITAANTGFGNVLDGLEFNHTAVALLGGQALLINLTGAAPEVRRFRDCAQRIGA